MKHVASLRYGVIFKKAFCHPEIFTSFIRDVLGVDLEIDSVETEKSYHPAIGPVDSRFDLFAEDVKNRVIVDIQHQRLKDHYDKFLHYHCVAMLEQIARCETYRSDVKVFTVVILTSGDRHKRDISVIDFDPRDRENISLDEIHHKVVYLCPKYADDSTPEPLREWLLAIEDTLDSEVDETRYRPEIRRIFDFIETSLITPKDTAEMKEEAARYEKLKELESRLAVIKEEGREEGREEGWKEIVRNMLVSGSFSVEQISEITGLTPDQIKFLC
ncbi:MAG: hypothetical protein B6244_10980 [Candidatus Cloacimonetes bacterium 4572_55]|nr:MAG: hypothetical protein B6244_10980 [Candidatus Cloacimonetes bacterium 4572_55]